MLDKQDFSDFRVGDLVSIDDGNLENAIIVRIGRSKHFPKDKQIYAWTEDGDTELGWWATTITLLGHDKEYKEAVAVLGEEYFA